MGMTKTAYMERQNRALAIYRATLNHEDCSVVEQLAEQFKADYGVDWEDFI